MSSDNGIYILKTKDQYRVTYAHAIDNLWWSFIDYNQKKDLVPTRLIEYFGGTRYTRHLEMVQKIAAIMNKNYGYTEYGICTIEDKRTWDQIVRQAKEYAKLEIASIKSISDNRWDHDLVNLEKMLTSL